MVRNESQKKLLAFWVVTYIDIVQVTSGADDAEATTPPTSAQGVLLKIFWIQSDTWGIF